jgi:WD40 repeat protein
MNTHRWLAMVSFRAALAVAIADGLPSGAGSQPADEQRPPVVKEVFKIEFKKFTAGVALSRDGRWLAGGEEEGVVVVWDAKLHKEILTLLPAQFGPSTFGSALAFDAKGVRIAVAAGRYFKCWDLDGGREAFSIERKVVIQSIMLHPNGKEFVLGCRDGTVEFRDAETGKFNRSFRPHRTDIRQIVFSPNGKLVASACIDKTAKILDSQTGQEIHSLNGHSQKVSSVDFSPCGRWLATGSSDNTVKIWDVKSGEALRSIPLKRSPNKVAFTPDGSFLTVGSSGPTGGFLAFHEVASGKEISRITNQDYGHRGIVFDKDGTRMATACGRFVRLFEISTPKVEKGGKK